MHKIVATLCCALTLLGAGARNINRPTESRLSIQALDCADRSAPQSSALEVSVSSLNRTKTVKRLVKGTGAIREFSLSLPQGRYIIGMNEGSCTANVLLSVLQGHARSVAVLLEPGFRVQKVQSSLIGSIPLRPRTITFEPGACDCPVSGVLEGNAYYFDHVPSGRGVIAVYLFGSDVPSRIPTDVSPGEGLVVRNLSASDIQHGYPSRP